MDVTNCQQQSAGEKVQLFWLHFHQRDLILIIIFVIIIYFRL